jgi:GTPase SAR1 family protein
MISIQTNKAPKLNKPTFHIDGKLHEKLDETEIGKLLNKPNFILYLGKAASGKSTMAISLINSKSLFKRVYHEIILFCPPNSRASITNDFWGTNLPEDCIYDELNLENLQEAYDRAQANRDEGLKTLILMDDVQKELKGECEKLLLHMVSNRRHASLSIWMLCQNYISIPRQVRQGLTDLFVFKVGKNEIQNIFNEQVEVSKEVFEEIQKILFKEPHEFLYINALTGRMFRNWDEIIIDYE